MFTPASAYFMGTLLVTVSVAEAKARRSQCEAVRPDIAVYPKASPQTKP
jgi:hypothetical protein